MNSSMDQVELHEKLNSARARYFIAREHANAAMFSMQTAEQAYVKASTNLRLAEDAYDKACGIK